MLQDVGRPLHEPKAERSGKESGKGSGKGKETITRQEMKIDEFDTRKLMYKRTEFWSKEVSARGIFWVIKPEKVRRALWVCREGSMMYP